MDVLAVIFVLGLTAGSCVALSHGVDIIDNVKKVSRLTHYTFLGVLQIFKINMLLVNDT